MFAKFLLTIAVIALIFFGFKYLQRVAELRTRKEQRPAGKPRFQPVENGESVHDLVKCPVCGTFRSPKAGPCGQSGCPY